MASSVFGDIVDKLRDEYTKGSMYGGQAFSANVGESLSSNWFMGSRNVVFISSNNEMRLEAPACIAAPLVTLVAKNCISLGMTGRGDLPVPVRLFAPNQISITTKQLMIGDVMLLGESKHGFISCKKLTLSKFTDEDPSHFEIVKSWVMDDVEIETIRR